MRQHVLNFILILLSLSTILIYLFIARQQPEKNAGGILTSSTTLLQVTPKLTLAREVAQKECGESPSAKRDSCLLSHSYAKNTTVACSLITNDIAEYQCYVQFAVRNNNSRACLMLPYSKSIRSPGDLYANTTSNVFKELCLTGIAWRNHNTGSCNDLREADMVSYCVASATRNSTRCKTINDSFRQKKCVESAVYNEEPEMPMKYENRWRFW